MSRPLSSLACAGLLGVLLSGLPDLAKAEDEFRYTVQQGDSAWLITERFLRQRSHWYQLRQLNRLAGDHLTPGQMLRIPLPWLRLETPEVRLSGLTGAVTLRHGGAWTAARAGATLAPGTWLRTPDDGSAQLTLADGTRILVRPGSEVQLQPLDATRLARALKTLQGTAPAAALGVRIDLLRGGLENQVRPQTGATRFEVRTPSAVTVVRGTTFRVSTDGHTSRAEVTHGNVDFDNPLGHVPLATATGSHVAPERPPAAAVPLLPAPALQDLPAHLSAARLRGLAIPPVAGAHRYRVQWLDDLGDDAPALRIDTEVVATQPLALLTLSDPPADTGRFVLRVRAIDADGLEGLDAEHRLVLQPIASPDLRAPPDQARMPDDRPMLQWAPASRIGRYRVQISPDPGLATDVIDHETGTDHWQPPPLPPGRYHWRVAGREGGADEDRTGLWLPWGTARRFEVPWGTPRLAPLQRHDEHLQLRWSGMAPGASVRLQIALDASFETVVLDEMHHFEGTDLPLPPRPGRYHVRIRSLGADGSASDWSAARSFDQAPAPPED